MASQLFVRHVLQNVPYQFSMEYLPKCKTEIVLRNLKGVSWTVNSVPTTRVHTSHTFCGGWLAFVRNNEIKMGDICIFELVGKCEMCVHLFQLGKQDDLDSSNGKAVCNELCVASNAISQNFFDDLPKKLIKNSAKVRSNSLKKVQKCGKKVSRMLDKSKHSDATKISARLPRTGNEKPGKHSNFSCSKLIYLFFFHQGYSFLRENRLYCFVQWGRSQKICSVFAFSFLKISPCSKISLVMRLPPVWLLHHALTITDLCTVLITKTDLAIFIVKTRGMPWFKSDGGN